MPDSDQIPALPAAVPIGPAAAVSETDVVIVGTGAAGMTAALRLTESGHRVTMISKDRLGDGSTASAHGGLAAVMGEADDADSHQQDTLIAGAGLSSPAAVSTLVGAAPSVIDRLDAVGAVFDRDRADRPRLGLEGGHSARRIVHAGGDATGAEIARSLAAQLSRRHGPGRELDIWEQTTAVDAILAPDGSVSGITVLDGSRRRIDVLASAVVLASGGIGRAWDSTTNPHTATGDGIGIALRAGAVIRDAEFVQFHPTMLATADWQPGDRGVLISEAVRGEGARLVDRDGLSIMYGRHPRGELAPRDRVAAAIHARLCETGADHLYLDGTRLGAAVWRERFPSALELCHERGLDPITEPLPVRPAEHYACGGVLATMAGVTTVAGLYAIGEAASTGVHGANRLASNSLTEAVLTGDRLGRLLTARDRSERHTRRPRLPDTIPPSPSPTSGSGSAGSQRRADSGRRWTIADADRERVVAAISHGAGVLRDEPGLSVLLKSLADCGSADRCTTRADLEATNLYTIGVLVAATARSRTESRGCHRRADHPQADPGQPRHSLAKLEADGQVIIDNQQAGPSG